jgi:histone H1/5
MADVENQTASSVTTGSAATPQSHAKKEKKAKNPRAKPSHPPTSEMVNNAIKGLKERGGSSLQAIKKFVAANYKVDAEKVAPFIKKYLKGAVASGSLVQTKGKGASGSFKLASSTSGGAKVASASDKRKPASSAASKTKKSSAKRTAVTFIIMFVRLCLVPTSSSYYRQRGTHKWPFSGPHDNLRRKKEIKQSLRRNQIK